LKLTSGGKLEGASKNKKADEAASLIGCGLVGLPVDQPPGKAELPFTLSSDNLLSNPFSAGSKLNCSLAISLFRVYMTRIRESKRKIIFFRNPFAEEGLQHYFSLGMLLHIGEDHAKQQTPVCRVGFGRTTSTRGVPLPVRPCFAHVVQINWSDMGIEHDGHRC
jgi:hypothetical protein